MGWKWTEAELAAYMETINGKKKAHLTAVPKITEKQFQEQVRKAAIMNGWRYFHTWSAIHSPEGFPDLVLVHAKKGRVIFAELKSEMGKVTAKQEEWLHDLTVVSCTEYGAAIEVYTWRPADIDAVWELLRR